MRNDRGLILTILISLVVVLCGVIYIATRYAPDDEAVPTVSRSMEGNAGVVPADPPPQSPVADLRVQSLDGEVVSVEADQVTVRTEADVELTFTLHETTRVLQAGLPISVEGIAPGDLVTVTFDGATDRPVARMIAVGDDAEV